MDAGGTRPHATVALVTGCAPCLPMTAFRPAFRGAVNGSITSSIEKNGMPSGWLAVESPLGKWFFQTFGVPKISDFFPQRSQENILSSSQGA